MLTLIACKALDILLECHMQVNKESEQENAVPKKRGRKKKLFEELPYPMASETRAPSDIGSANGEIVNMKMETADIDVSIADDVSIQSLDDGKFV